MEKFDSVGITSHFENLPFGRKDAFIREVADALGLSSSSVRKKIQNGNWRKLEIPIITKPIQK